jgi:trehalose-6-phosphate synthase
MRTHKASWFGWNGEIRLAGEADVTKGLPHKLKAFFRQLLDKYPQYRRQVVLTQIAPPTRESVEAYSDIAMSWKALQALSRRHLSLIADLHGDAAA